MYRCVKEERNTQHLRVRLHSSLCKIAAVMVGLIQTSVWPPIRQRMKRRLLNRRERIDWLPRRSHSSIAHRWAALSRGPLWMCLLRQPLISVLFGRHSLRAQTDSLSAHEPNLVATGIYQTRRSYLQVTQSLSKPSIHPSLLPHPPPSHPLPSFLSPGPCKLIKRGRNPTLHTDGIAPRPLLPALSIPLTLPIPHPTAPKPPPPLPVPWQEMEKKNVCAAHIWNPSLMWWMGCI